jgi:NAD(P)-dependent dehydrogenase (short-subunit alcohol dehydrogenase family)
MAYDLSGKTVLITGANAGIGKAAALQLARLGARVVLACRSAERGARALEDVRQAAGSAALELLQVDMASQASIRRAVAEFTLGHDRLDVLIHNAANFDLTAKRPLLTAEGVETIFATNHVGPFLMTSLLLDLLKASAPSRVITVASKGLTLYPNLDIEFDNLNGERSYTPQHAYYLSKLAQVMFTYDLAERFRGAAVTVNCVRVTNVAVGDERLGNLPGWMKRLYALKRKMALTPEQMAETYVYLAADPAVESQTGLLWDEHNRPVKSNQNSYNRATWKRLWEVSEGLIKISTTEPTEPTESTERN